MRWSSSDNKEDENLATEGWKWFVRRLASHKLPISLFSPNAAAGSLLTASNSFVLFFSIASMSSGLTLITSLSKNSDPPGTAEVACKLISKSLLANAQRRGRDRSTFMAL